MNAENQTANHLAEIGEAEWSDLAGTGKAGALSAGLAATGAIDLVDLAGGLLVSEAVVSNGGAITVTTTGGAFTVAASVDSRASTVAPRNAPTAPGTPSRVTSRQSTLPNRQCDTPDARVVPTSARCTDADAVAGASPTNSRRLVEVAP